MAIRVFDMVSAAMAGLFFSGTGSMGCNTADATGRSMGRGVATGVVVTATAVEGISIDRGCVATGSATGAWISVADGREIPRADPTNIRVLFIIS